MPNVVARALRSAVAWRVVLGSYWAALFVSTHLPRVGQMPAVARHDELLHIVAFGVLAFLLAATWQLNAGELTLPQLGWVWFAVVLYAVFDEWTQQYVGRIASFTDWIADAAGAAIGLIAFAVVRRWLRNSG